jgi:hypothetical protein
MLQKNIDNGEVERGNIQQNGTFSIFMYYISVRNFLNVPYRFPIQFKTVTRFIWTGKGKQRQR